MNHNRHYAYMRTCTLSNLGVPDIGNKSALSPPPPPSSSSFSPSSSDCSVQKCPAGKIPNTFACLFSMQRVACTIHWMLNWSWQGENCWLLALGTQQAPVTHNTDSSVLHRRAAYSAMLRRRLQLGHTQYSNRPFVRYTCSFPKRSTSGNRNSKGLHP